MRTGPRSRLWELEDRYRGRFAVSPLSYGTVADFADSRDNLGGLARPPAEDMKGMQRSWMVKAVLGTVPPGARLLEVGAGEPLVASLLAELGYEVTVVDPYDGSGNGPRDFERHRDEHPELTFVRRRFPTSEGLVGSYGAVYSISVLEHVPAESAADLAGACLDRLGAGGVSLHAIDHVVAGWGADEHLRRLEEIVRGSRLSIAELEPLLARLRDDPETYFVSAEAHERWRGDAPYETYPMRRIASIALCARAAGDGGEPSER